MSKGVQCYHLEEESEGGRAHPNNNPLFSLTSLSFSLNEMLSCLTAHLEFSKQQKSTQRNQNGNDD